MTAEDEDVVPLDVPASDRWWQAARSSLETASLVAEHGQHHYACLAAEQAAQQALKGLLHGVGRGPEARGHDLVATGDRATEASGTAPPDGLADVLLRLGRHYLPARYPDALNGGSPPTRFGEQDSAQAIADADDVLAYVRRAWAALLAAGEEAGT